MILLLLGCWSGDPGVVGQDPLAQMRGNPLVLTRHAECRMKCRHITEDEVRTILAKGDWIRDRTRTDGKCPSHALEGPDDVGGPLRIVFAACPTQTKVVTAIDLDDDFKGCSCR